MDLKRLNIESLIPGMQNVDIIGVVSKISKKNFSTEKGSGRIGNVIISDATGSIRLVLWNDEIEVLGDLQEGEIIRFMGYVRQGIFGPELRLGRFGKIERSGERVSRRSRISDLKEGEKKEIRAALVQLFESNPFYEICPQCGISLKEEGDIYKCINHGQQDPAYALHISGILDDGSDNIRCTLFKEQAEKILGVNANAAKDIVLRKGMAALFARAKFGEYVFEGQIRRNKFFDRLEFIANSVKEVDVKDEISALLGQGQSIKIDAIGI